MATLGGILISLSTSFNLFAKGRLTGLSGIYYGLITLNDVIWRSAIIFGMIWTSSLIKILSEKNSYFFDSTENNLQNLSLRGFIISGFLVGLGTKLANGCTSGHGVCGLPRLSKRSFSSVITFCIFGIATASFRYYENFFYETEYINYAEKYDTEYFHKSFFIFISLLLCLMFLFLLTKKTFEEIKDFIISFITGSLFASGLIISGMNKRRKVIGFLTFNTNWDPSLIFVLMSAFGFNYFFFKSILRKKSPLFATKFALPTLTEIDFRLIFGSAIFGVGWGISGLCPGPVIVSFFNYIPHLLIFLASLTVGQLSVFAYDDFVKDLNNFEKKENNKKVKIILKFFLYLYKMLFLSLNK